MNNVIKICIFILIVNLPFLTITQLVGMETFLDSFEHPESYQYINSDTLDIDEINRDYIVLQKPSHPDFSIVKGDEIFYLNDEGGLMCSPVYYVNNERVTKRYYTIDFNDKLNAEPVYEYQIIGKVVCFIDDNIWNTLSLKIWDMSVNNLNAVALFTGN